MVVMMHSITLPVTLLVCVKHRPQLCTDDTSVAVVYSHSVCSRGGLDVPGPVKWTVKVQGPDYSTL